MTDEYRQRVIERNGAENLAVSILWALSGRQFGLAEHLVRPCPPQRQWPGSGSLVGSYLLSWEGDRWVNWPCGCSGGCQISGPRAVHLPGPVHSITEVKIANVVTDDDTYKLEGNTLYRVGGQWPYQDLSRPSGEVNTWTVKYQRGIPVPPGVDQYTGILANEILAAIDGDGKCRLPRTVTTASRNGVTYRAYDPAKIYAEGKTGIPEIDLWLAAVNPNHLTAAPTVI